jgi:hypothetical protein
MNGFNDINGTDQRVSFYEANSLCQIDRSNVER